VFQMPSNLSQLRKIWRVANNIEPQAPNGAYTIKNTDTSTAFYVFDVIGGYDDDAASFVEAVHNVSSDTVDLFINSPGGFVWDALSMYDSLVNSPATVNVSIMGLAASAASLLAMSGDKIKITEAGRMMVHDAQGIGIGSPADMREYADMLDNTSNDIAGIYASRAGGKPAAWRSAMTATTWYSSSQAVDSKLADEVSKNKTQGPDNRTRLIQARARVLTNTKGN
jgi:ATP-dependent protease ClpP protease subunit